MVRDPEIEGLTMSVVTTVSLTYNTIDKYCLCDCRCDNFVFCNETARRAVHVMLSATLTWTGRGVVTGSLCACAGPADVGARRGERSGALGQLCPAVASWRHRHGDGAADVSDGRAAAGAGGRWSRLDAAAAAAARRRSDLWLLLQEPRDWRVGCWFVALLYAVMHAADNNTTYVSSKVELCRNSWGKLSRFAILEHEDNPLGCRSVLENPGRRLELVVARSSSDTTAGLEKTRAFL